LFSVEGEALVTSPLVVVTIVRDHYCSRSRRLRLSIGALFVL